MDNRERRSFAIRTGAAAALLLTPVSAVEGAALPPTVFPQLLAPSSATLRAVANETVTLEVKGMTCGGCALAVRQVLGRLEGVERVEVNLEEGTAVVSFDPARVSVESLVDAIARAGFEGRPVLRGLS